MATFQENNSGLDSQACKISVNCPPLKVHGIHCKAKLPERRKWWPWEKKKKLMKPWENMQPPPSLLVKNQLLKCFHLAVELSLL